MTPKICVGFSTNDWQNLCEKLDDKGVLSEAWLEAISVFERRMRERYFTAIDALVSADTHPNTLPGQSSNITSAADHCTPGFSIMALCCLLIEALQNFRERVAHEHPSRPCDYPTGRCIRPPSGTNEQFRRFLRRPAFAEAFSNEKTTRDFMNGIRNGILHQAETRKWIIRRDEPKGKIVETRDGGRYILNRTVFYERLKEEFKSFLCELRDPDGMQLRLHLKKSMNDISKEA